ncbi:nuclear transport factor 2 family protein [Georgenia daeguensis]|uniref:Nuclear transport factor 2 family protein n=1 Tax=Georgenia daeguensis TaxID=908355 RepID=A0ABP8EV61_9MICO
MNDAHMVRQAVEQWAVWRDAGYWDRFATLWHDEGTMSATWFVGGYRDFIEASRRGFDSGVRILHFLGGSAVDVTGDRAVSETKMTITQRAEVHGVLVDVICTGRFYDFFIRDAGEWLLRRRQPIYEMDRMVPVVPGAVPELDMGRWESLPFGYRNLGYIQEQLGMKVRTGLPELTGAATEQLYRDGAAWLEGQSVAGEGAVRADVIGTTG